MLMQSEKAIAQGAGFHPQHISEIVPHWASVAPDGVAISESRRHYTYAEMDVAIRGTAETLSHSGVRPGDRVMIVCENSCAAVVIYFALTQIAAWPVPINARLSDREVDEIRDHCGARLIVYALSNSQRAKAHSARHGATTVEWPALGDVTVGALNESTAREPVTADPSSDVAAMIYTSGTTGRPKGVMLTHRNLLSVAEASSEARDMSQRDSVYAVLPISHILGLTGVLISSFLRGACVHIVSRFDPVSALEAIRNGHVSVMIGTPSMYALLAEYAERRKLTPLAPSALRLISSAGAPLDATTKALAERAFGQTLHNGYGITEMSPTLTLTRLDAPRSDCSVGRLLPGIEARLLNPEGLPVAVGETGEMFVRGPGVMKGYYNAPDETALAVDNDGWFRTGDLARVEDDHYFIVGRAKEMIIRFGFNVYPAEVESVLNTHPAVAMSAVIGRKSESTEDILAFVQIKDGATAVEADLMTHAAEHLTAYKRPLRIFVIASFPLTPAGKVMKSELPALAASLA